MVTPVRPKSRRLTPLAAVARDMSATLPPSGDHLSVSGVTHDSRLVEPGDLYAALPGTHAHGAAFARQAVGRGATAIVTDLLGKGIVQRVGVPVIAAADPRRDLGKAASLIYGHPSRELAVYGVTGTNGKTTTAYLLDAGLRGCGRVTGVIGTIETRIAGERHTSQRTTPEATDLQALLAVMLERGVDAVAMEVSSHALSLGRVTGTHFRAGLFTNLSQDHLDFHPTMEDYFEAKAALFARSRCDLGVVDVDDAWGRRLARRLRAAGASAPALTTVGADGEWAVAPREGGFRLSRGTRTVPCDLRLLGGFNTSNAALALAALIETGCAPEAAATGIAGLDGVPGRMERVGADGDLLALVDYAHTPDAVVTLLRAVRPLAAGRLIVVLGCGGDRDRAKRPLMGAAAARYADVAVLTDDNPRSEPSARILAAMEQGAEDVPAAARAHVMVEPDRARAIALAVALAEPGDTVVVAGKGHETGQEIRGSVTPFDDRAVLRAALRDGGHLP